MDDLTREQKHLIVSMYKEMLLRSRQSTMSLEEARRFDNSDIVKDLFCPSQTLSLIHI